MAAGSIERQLAKLLQSRAQLFALLFFLFALLNISTLANPPYWDEILGLHNQAIYLARSNFDLPQLYRAQEQFRNGGSCVYPFGIMPFVYGALYSLLPPVAVHIAGHLINLASLAAAGMLFLRLVRKFCSPGLTLLWGIAAFSEPILSGRMAAQGQEAALAFGIMLSLSLFFNRREKAALAAAFAACLIKTTGIVLLCAYAVWFLYAAAAGLIHNINRNERQLDREFDHGESRVFASADLLDKRKNGRPVLPPGLFVGIDDDIANTGVTVFAPALRQESFLARKREYLRNLESLIGLKRGILGEVEAAQRTATEVTSSQGDYSLTIQELQQMWESAVRRALVLCGRLGRLYRVPGAFVPDPARAVRIDWGNGVLFDRDREWAELMQLVEAGLLKPELALAWKYGLPWDTDADLARVRRQLMPGETAANNS